MGERMEYYKRIQMAKDFSKQYILMISDGMQQAHSQIHVYPQLESGT